MKIDALCFEVLTMLGSVWNRSRWLVASSGVKFDVFEDSI